MIMATKDTFLFQNTEDIKDKHIDVFKEGLFGKKKQSEAYDEYDPDVTPEYIQDILDSTERRVYKTIVQIVDTEYKNAIAKMKKRNPEAFNKLLISKQGDTNEQEFVSTELSAFWKQIAIDKGALEITPDYDSGDMGSTKNKDPFMRVFEDRLFNTDSFTEIPQILANKFGDDLKELILYANAYDKDISNKQKMALFGFTEDSVIKNIATNKLAMILLGYMILKEDPRLSENFQNSDQIMDQEIAKLRKRFYSVSGDAKTIANSWLNNLKSIPPEQYKKSGQNPYETAIVQVYREIEKTIRQAKKKVINDDDEYAYKQKISLSYPETEKLKTSGFPEPEFEIDQSPKDKLKATEKELEDHYALNPPMHIMHSAENAQAIISAVENPQRVLNMNQDDFRQLKSLIAFNSPYSEENGEVKRFKEKILPQTRQEFALYLKSLQENPKEFSRFIDLWNENPNIKGKLFTQLDVKDASQFPTNPSEKSDKEKKMERPRGMRRGASIKSRTPIANKKSNNRSDDEIKLSLTDEEDAALQSSKGVEEFLKSNKGKNLKL
jgi:hypothetical protein